MVEARFLFAYRQSLANFFLKKLYNSPQQVDENFDTMRTLPATKCSSKKDMRLNFFLFVLGMVLGRI